MWHTIQVREKGEVVASPKPEIKSVISQTELLSDKDFILIVRLFGYLIKYILNINY